MNYAKVLLNLYQLKQNEKKSAGQMKQIQEEKIRKLLSYVWEHSKFYRRTFTEAGITREELSELPLLAFPTINKKILMEHFDELITVNDIKQEDMLWFEDGNGKRDFLHPLAVEGFCVEGLRDYQFRKTSRSAFEMLAEVPQESRRAGVRQEMLNHMEQILKEKKLMDVEFNVRFVKEILPDSHTGKKPLILPQNSEVMAI